MSDVVLSSEYMFASNQECVTQHMTYYNKLMETNNQAEMNRQMRGLEADIIQYHGHGWIITTFILEWTTRLDTSSRTLFVREGGREDVSPDVHVTSNVELRNNVRLLLNVELRNITSDC